MESYLFKNVEFTYPEGVKIIFDIFFPPKIVHVRKSRSHSVLIYRIIELFQY